MYIHTNHHKYIQSGLIITEHTQYVLLCGVNTHQYAHYNTCMESIHINMHTTIIMLHVHCMNMLMKMNRVISYQQFAMRWTLPLFSPQ